MTVNAGTDERAFKIRAMQLYCSHNCTLSHKLVWTTAPPDWKTPGSGLIA